MMYEQIYHRSHAAPNNFRAYIKYIDITYLFHFNLHFFMEAKYQLELA